MSFPPFGDSTTGCNRQQVIVKLLKFIPVEQSAGIFYS